MSKAKLLCITPVKHIDGFVSRLEQYFDLTYLPDPVESELAAYDEVEVIFTNPNKTKVFLGPKVLKGLPKLKVIATASTGTVHIDKDYCKEVSIEVVSLTKEIPVLERITSTAEHAFLLTLAACRNLVKACKSVDSAEWDYEKFVGRQMNQLKVGVLGYGRLGKMYAKYAADFGAEVLVCDPYIPDLASSCPHRIVSAEQLFTECDVVSIHIHATKDNTKFVNQKFLDLAKPNLLLINTARGEVICETDILSFLGENPKAKYYTDVLFEEFRGVENNALYSSALYGEQVVITPHIAGMTIDAQQIAYNHCLVLLVDFLQMES